MKPKRSHKQDKLAKLYDGEILPIWSQRFGKMLLRDLALPPKATVLDVACGTGYPALEVVRRMDERGKIIAIDPSSPMLDVAREKAGPLSGRRIFFRSESAEPRLSFADDVYDLVMSNLGIHELEQPEVAVRDFARVTKPGGRVVFTLPLDGTFGEFYDIFREVLIKRDRAEALERLDSWLLHQPTPQAVRTWCERAGLVDVTVEEEKFTLLFKSSREFFFAPVIEYGELSRWKEIAGRGPELQDVFWHIKAAIDAYFGESSFNVTVIAGCVRGRKMTEEEASEATGRRPLVDAASAAQPIEAPEDVATGQIVLSTGEIEVLDERDADELPFPDDDDDDLL